MFDLGRVSHTVPYLFADTAEIAIFSCGYAQVSATDLLGIMKQSPRVDSELLPLTEEDLDDNEYADTMSGTEISNKQQAYIEECFRQLDYRSRVLGDIYPFILDGECLSLKTELNDYNRLYLFLLACSRSRTYKIKGAAQRLADAFEEICLHCMKAMLSPQAECYMFGPNSIDREQHFSTNLTVALPILVKKLGMKLCNGWQKSYGSAGDGGIDLIGVYNFNDSAMGHKVVIGQCAAIEDSKNWQSKRMEALFDSKRGAFHFLVEPDPMLFISSCFRQPDGDWVDDNHVSSVIAIDRIRILNVLQQAGSLNFSVSDMFNRVGIIT